MLIQSVERAMQILEILKGSPKGMGVSEIANQLGVAKSTAHRLLMTLESGSYVSKVGKDSLYSLGLKFLEMNQVVIDNINVVEIARPHLENLSKETGEIVHLVMLDGNEILYIDKVENSSTIRIYSQIGKRAALYCTGVGKAILSKYDEKQLDDYLNNNTFHKYTEYTLTTPEELKNTLKEVSANGFAYDNQEHELGIRCVAAEIFDSSRKANYGISITGPIARMTDQHLETYIPKLRETADSISRKLGYRK